MGHCLWRVNRSAVYNCCWCSPAQSFLGPSPAELVTWRATSTYLYPPGTGYPSYTPRHWVPFSSPPTTRRATVEVFEPISTLVISQSRSHIATDCRSVSQSVLVSSTIWGHDQIFITVSESRSCLCGASTLTRGRIRILSESLFAVISNLLSCKRYLYNFTRYTW
jgi:hypothetical protein